MPADPLPRPQRPATLSPAEFFDSRTGEALDRLTRWATKLLHAPVAFISMTDGDRHLIKSSVGLPEPWAEQREIPLSGTFLRHVVASGEPLIVEDARNDTRVREDPVFSEAGLIAGLTLPIASLEGQLFGTFSVCDVKPRSWSEEEIETLRDLAAAVRAEIELRMSIVERDALRNERATEEQEIRFQARLLDAVEQGVIATDLQGKILFWNRRAETLYGWSAQEVRGRNILEVTPSLSSRAEAESIMARLREGENWSGEFQVQRRDGTPFWVTVTNSPVLDSEGRLVGIIGVSSDLSPRKRQEEERRTILTHARCILWLAEIEDAGEELKWDLRVSDLTAAQQVLPLDLVPGEPYIDAWRRSRHPEDKADTDARGNAAIRRGQRAYRQDFRCLDREGRLHWLHEEVSVEPLGPGRWRAVGVCTDITERKRMEETLRLVTAGAQSLFWYAEVVVNEEGWLFWKTEFFDEESVRQKVPLEIREGETFADAWYRSRLPEDRKRADEQANAAIRNGEASYRQEFRHRLKDGQIAWFLQTVSVERLEKKRWRLVGACVDITEQKRIAEELENVLRHARGILWSAIVERKEGREGPYLRWRSVSFNEEAAQEILPLEVQPGESYDVAWWRSRHPEDDRNMRRTSHQAFLSGARSYGQEFRSIDRDGKERWFYEDVSIQALGDGCWQAVGIVTDITERKRAEQERDRILNELQHALAQADAARDEVGTILDSMTDSFFVLDESWKVVYFNEAAARLLPRLNLSEEEIAHADFWSLFPELVNTATERAFRRTAETQESSHLEVYYPRLKGWFEARIYPMEDGVSVYFQEITVRKRAEEELKRRALQQAAVAELGQRVLEGADLPTLMNDAAVRVAETLGTDFTEILELQPGEEEFLLRAGVGWEEGRVGRDTVPAGPHSLAGYTLLSSEPVIVEDLRTESRFSGPPLLHDHGVVSGISALIPGKHRPWGVIGAHTSQPQTFTRDDLHFFQAVANVLAAAIERIRLEAELRERATALERADQQKDIFLAMLAHELRNPLAPILNAVQIMRMRGHPDPALQRARDMVERQVHHMSRLLEDLLDVSRITLGKVELRRERVDLRAVAENAIQTARPFIEARNHRFSIHRDTEPVPVEADPARLEQVIVNLLSNAAKYTEPGGTITLTATQVGEEAVVRVRDTGIGIAPEMLPHIFDLFAQAETSLDRSQGGLGIGLTLVKHLVEKHHGRVTARSDGAGRGTEFEFRIPALPLLPEEVKPSENAVGDIERVLRILIVDDNRDAAESLGDVLSLHGNEIRTAHDGPAALEAAHEFQPDVVLLDIGLPGMDGYEVARTLRGWEDLKDVILIALTGYGQEEDRRLSREAGFDRHLVKPVDLMHLQQLLQQLTGTDRSRQE
ncbi:MAG: PAS domain S-box protein [Armatimonadetes bacterium]|nr:PAS domain S-box protein [Armatimonadota bacterium]